MNKTEKLNKSRLYAIIDRRFLNRWSFEELICIFADNGVDIVQLREKRINRSKLLDYARQLQELCSKHNLIFILNDYPEITKEVETDGLHIGVDDGRVGIIRKKIGENKIIGWSATNMEEALKGVEDGADYLGVGAIFPTSTKGDAKLVSEIKLAEIDKACSIPVFAIGGINPLNLSRLIELEIRRVVICQALLESDDLIRDLRFFRRRLDGLL